MHQGIAVHESFCSVVAEVVEVRVVEIVRVVCGVNCGTAVNPDR